MQFRLTKVLFGLAFVSLAGCDQTPMPTDHDFDRETMLRSMANELILVEMSDFSDAASTFLNEANGFIQSPDLPGLGSLKDAWQQLALQWQRVLPFGTFGPAENSFGTMREDLGTFPVDTVKTLAYLAARDTAFNNFDRDTRGIWAVEYLLFHGNGESDVLDDFTGQESELWKGYLLALARNIRNQASEVSAAWTGNVEAFASNSGTDAGSSTSTLYNEMVASYELLKNAKIGLPAGKRPGQVQAEPHLVEAYFSGLSLELGREHLESVQRIWSGINRAGATFPGFEEYLEVVVGGPELIASTKEQMIAVESAFDALGAATLSVEIEAGNPAVDVLHTELQKLTRFLKSDMSSLLGISITYDSGDGD